MAWGRNEEITKEKMLELIGLDPTKLEERLTAMGTSITEFNTLKEKINSLDDIKATLTRLEGRMPKVEEENNDGNGNGNGDRSPKIPSVLEDEDAAFAGHINKAMGPVLQMTINTNAEMAYNNFKATKTDFSVFEKDIRERWNKIPINEKVNAASLINNLYFMYKGMKVDADGNKVNFFVEPGGDNGGTHQRGEDDKKKTPLERATDKDKEQASKWGIPLEKFMQTKENMAFVGGGK